MKSIDIAEVIKDMEAGYTRLKKQDNPDGRSIQEKYGLSTAEVRCLFELDELRNINARRVGIGISFVVTNSKDSKMQAEVAEIVEASNTTNETNIK